MINNKNIMKKKKNIIKKKWINNKKSKKLNLYNKIKFYRCKIK